MFKSYLATALLGLGTWTCLDAKKGKEQTPVPDVASNSPEALDAQTAQALTYHKDVRAIFENKCVSCHSPGEVGGFSLTNYQQVTRMKEAIKSAVSDRGMPPWIADAGHQIYKDDLSLSALEQAKVLKWLELGLKEGDAKDYRAVEKASEFVGDHPFNIFTDDGRYLPTQKISDDYRCFIVPYGDTLKDEMYVTGFNASAGNKKIVHHIVAYIVDEAIVKYLQELDAEEEGRGYECFGGATPDRLGKKEVADAFEKKYPGSMEKINDSNYWLAHWAPGMDAGYLFPDETGIKLPKNGAFVVQMHYYTVGAKGEEDENTNFSIKTAKTVRKPAFYYPMTKQAWLMSKQNKSMVIAPESEESYETQVSLAQIAAYGKRKLHIQAPIKHLESHSANLHMHAFGKSGVIRQGRNDGGQLETLLSVSKWDLHWQRDFQVEKAKIVPASEWANWSRYLSCSYVNPNQEPVYGGFGSYDEMCFDFGYFAFELESN